MENSDDPSLGTTYLSSKSDAYRIEKFLEAQIDFVNAPYIAKELDINYETVRKNLKRLHRKGKALSTYHLKNKKFAKVKDKFFPYEIQKPQGYWIYIDWKESNKKTLGTKKVGGSSQMSPTLANSPPELREETLTQFVGDYDSIHGITATLTGLGAIKTFEQYELDDGRTLSLEKGKLRIGATLNPIKLGDCYYYWGKIESELKNLGVTYDKSWLIHIEFNKDHEGYRLDGLQRVQVKIFMDKVARLYNKKIGGKQFLRSELLYDFKNGVISLAGALFFVSAARDVISIYDIVKAMVTTVVNHGPQIKKSNEMLATVSTKLGTGVDYIQSQLIDYQTSVEQNTQVQESILQAILQQTPILESSNQFLDLQTGELAELKDLVSESLKAQNSSIVPNFSINKNGYQGDQVLEILQNLGRPCTANEVIGFLPHIEKTSVRRALTTLAAKNPNVESKRKFNRTEGARRTHYFWSDIND